MDTAASDGAGSEPRQSPLEGSLRSFFAAAPASLTSAYLFGSRARGTEREGSDVDVAVLFSTPPERTLRNTASELEGDLERVLRLPVQVVVLNTAPPDLVHRVLRDGHILLDRDRSARIQFEVKARNEFFDIQPMLNLYRKGRT